MSSWQTLDLDDETLMLFDDFDATEAGHEDSGSLICDSHADESSTSLLLSQVAYACEVTTGDKRDREAKLPQPQEVPKLQSARLQRKKKAARVSEASLTAPAPAPVVTAAPPATKKPRKLNHIEIRKLREQVEELQAHRTKLELFGSDRPNEMRMATAAGGTIQLSVSVAVAEQHENMKRSEQLKAAATTAAVTSQSSTDTISSIETSAASPPRSVWLDLAVEQYKHLQHSEAWNRRLRAAVSKQLKVTNLLQPLLRMKVSPQELNLLLGSPHPTPAVHMQMEFASPQEQQLAELYLNMESQFHETDLVLCHGIRASNNADSVFLSSHTRDDEVRGPTFELTTNTPVADDFQSLGDVMWRRFLEKKRFPVVENLPDTQHRFQPLKRAPWLLALDDKRVRLMLSSKFGGEHQMDGVIAVGKFREAHRTVITIASAYTVSGVDVVFRESAWIVISEDVNNATNSSVKREAIRESPLRSLAPSSAAVSSALFQTFYRLHSEKRDPRTSTGSLPFTEALDEKTKNVQELGMQLLSDQLRQHMTQLQGAMLSEVGLVAANMMGVKCSLADRLS